MYYEELVSELEKINSMSPEETRLRKKLVHAKKMIKYSRNAWNRDTKYKYQKIRDDIQKELLSMT